MKKNIKTYPNQKVRIIDRPAKIEGIFAIFDKKALAKACENLNGGALKLWLYLMSQEPQIEWVISKRAIANDGWLSAKTYRNAIKELENKGYIDNYRVYMYPKIDTAENGDIDIPEISNNTAENGDRNINNNNYNNIGFLNDPVEKTYKPKEKIIKMRSSELDFKTKGSDFKWRDEVDDNGLLITPTGKKIQVIMDD